MTTEDEDHTAEVQDVDQDQEAMTEGNHVPGAMRRNDQGAEVAVHTHVLEAGHDLTGQGRTAVLVQGQEVMAMKEKQEVEAERHRKIRKIVICRLKSLLNKNNNFSSTLHLFLDINYAEKTKKESFVVVNNIRPVL